MTAIEDHTEIFEAALESLPEGIAVLDEELRVLFWNRAAATITGYPAAELRSRTLPTSAYQIVVEHQTGLTPKIAGANGRPLLVHLRHRQGHTLPAMLRRTALRDALGKRFGTMLRFHPIEDVDALPHGEVDSEGSLQQHVEHSQAAMEDRLDEAWRDWSLNRVPFGLLWIRVDQAGVLRRTHGQDAAETMMGIVERTLIHALRPAEMLGRWGTHEFLVLCHERTEAMLAAHGQHVAELAQTADFRWWGDRVPLTASVGAAQASEGETLARLLLRAKTGMETSGGNFKRSRTDTGGMACSQS